MRTVGKRQRFWLTLVIFSLVGQIAWVVENMYFNVFMYKMFAASADQISLMVALSAVSATLTTIFIGALADKLARRKIFMVAGYLLWGVSILSFALVREDVLTALFPTVSAAALGVTLVIVLDCVMTFFGSSANDAAFNAWLTDNATEQNRGAAEGINAMMPLLAIIAVFGGFMAFDLSSARSWTVIYIIIGTVVFVIGILGIFLIDEQPMRREENTHYAANILYGFRPSVIRRHPSLYTALAAFALFGISIQIFMPYLILYYSETLKMQNYVVIMAPAIVLASIFTAFYGRLFDRHGYARTVIPSLLLLMAGYVLLFLFRSETVVFFGSLLMMCGYLSGMAVFGAEVRTHIPEGRAGMFQGLRIVAQVLIPGVIGPAIGAAVLRNADTVVGDDGTVSFLPNENIFLAALIVAALLLAALCLLLLLRSRRRTGEVDV